MDAQMTAKDRWLHRYAVLTACATLFLILAGGMVTSTGSGLAVPDWPLSYGMVFPPMVGGVFYEHGHRMVATFVGFLTTVMAFWLWLQEARRWVRNLGFVALLAVIVQGMLGGLTVIFLLPTAISVTHACLAQTFFCLTVGLAVFTSASWRLGAVTPVEGGVGLRKLAVCTTAVIYVQLILGALMRHTESGLAIPDFPLSFGAVFPPLSELTVHPNAPYPISLAEFQKRVVIHFAHRAWAGVVLGMIVWTAVRVGFRHRRELVVPAVLMLGLVMVQVTLGAYVVWMEKNVGITTTHVVVGASILATSVILTLRCWRLAGVSEEPAKQVVPHVSGEPAV